MPSIPYYTILLGEGLIDVGSSQFKNFTARTVTSVKASAICEVDASQGNKIGHEFANWNRDLSCSHV